MKIAVTAKGKGLDAKYNQHLGRCEAFLIHDTLTGGNEWIDNPGCSASGGAGPVAVEALGKSGVSRVVTGSPGPNAQRVLVSLNIEVQSPQFDTSSLSALEVMNKLAAQD